MEVIFEIHCALDPSANGKIGEASCNLSQNYMPAIASASLAKLYISTILFYSRLARLSNARSHAADRLCVANLHCEYAGEGRVRRTMFQAPAKQNATTTISTLCGRLQSATLLEDRRAAVLGLRSFAKVYPASVASGALRSLISCLNKDVEDVDTTKVILETLLMLFNPDEKSVRGHSSKPYLMF